MTEGNTVDDAKATNPETTAGLVKALARARQNFARVEKDGQNPHLHNRYATLGAVLDAVTGPLLDAGIVVTQTPIPVGVEAWALKTTLLHVGGGEISGLVPLEYGEAKGLNPMQALGSAISYGRRYGLLSLLCLTAEDDDGATAGATSYARQGGHDAPPARGYARNSNRAPAPRPAPTEDEAREARSKALRALNTKPPQTGKGLFRLLMDLDPSRGLLKAVNDFGGQQGWGPKLVEWSIPHVLEAIRFVRDELEVQAASDRELD